MILEAESCFQSFMKIILGSSFKTKKNHEEYELEIIITQINWKTGKQKVVFKAVKADSGFHFGTRNQKPIKNLPWEQKEESLNYLKNHRNRKKWKSKQKQKIKRIVPSCGYFELGP